AATDVQAAIDEINAAAGTVALVDNGDGTYTFTDASGTPTVISDTSISTMVDNLDGTYTYTDETGAAQLIDTNASSNPYDNTTSGLAATDVQAAIDEINAAAGTVALVDNGDGTYTFTDAAGGTTLISDTSISTLVNNGDATFTYTDETGTPITINMISADANNDIVAGTDGGLYLNVASVVVGETITNIVDNADGTFTYTNENGVDQTINKADVTDNGDGTYTFTNNDGTDVTLNTNANSNPYDNTTSGLTATDVQAAIDEINAAAGTVALVDNLDGTYTFTDAGGNVTTITDTSISTLVDNGDGSFTYTDETGTTTIFTETLTTLVDNANGTFTYTNEDGIGQTISRADMIDNFDGTYVFNNFDGTPVTVNTNAISNPYDNTTSGLTATDVQAAIDEINAAAGTVSLVDNLDGTYTFTDASGTPTVISDTSISTLIDNGDGTYDYTDELGVTTTIIGADDQILSTDSTPGNISIEDGNTITLNVDDADAVIGNEYNTGAGMNAGSYEITDGGGTIGTNLISTDANNDIAAGSDGALYLNVASVTIAETITNIVDNANGTFTYTNEDGVAQTISKSDVTDNGDGTYTFTNNDGTDVTLDTRAASNPYDNTTSGLTATDVQAAIDEVAAGSTDDQNISGSGLAGTTLTIGIENGTNETVDLSSLVDDADAVIGNEFNTG
ncbi:MAG: hypothetical protein OER83_08760, partial [Flavobacteriaceae bacterium]|nr:hypothetical protein [Flavobacteriaceae bacterium]